MSSVQMHGYSADEVVKLKEVTKVIVYFLDQTTQPAEVYDLTKHQNPTVFAKD